MHALDMILNFFRDGGIFQYPLALIWVVGLVIAFERFGFIMRVGAGNRRMWAEVQPLLEQGKFSEALSAVQDSETALAHVMRYGIPLRDQDPRLTVAPEGAAVRVGSVDGEYWQRLWTEADDPEVARGEVGRAAEVSFTFAFADRRPTDGRSFPFQIRVEESATRSRLHVQYERVQLNLRADPDLFELPPPTDPQTRIIDLGSGAPARVAP